MSTLNHTGPNQSRIKSHQRFEINDPQCSIAITIRFSVNVDGKGTSRNPERINHYNMLVII